MATRLIFGCGYLGKRVADRWREGGDSVWAVTRSPTRSKQFEAFGLQPIVADVANPTLELPAVAWDTVLWAVGYDRTAGRPMRDVYVDGLRRAISALPSETGSLIYVSSTGVYGQIDGGWVDEDSECRPTREGGKICLEAERLLQDHAIGERSIILRMAGIYGPGRLPRRRELMAGEPISTAVQGSLNLIQVDDAAAVVTTAEQFSSRPNLYLVADGHPVERPEYYRHLAALIGAPSPKFVPPEPGQSKASRSSADKRISSRKLMEQLPVRLRYPTYREGLRAALEAEDKATPAQNE